MGAEGRELGWDETIPNEVNDFEPIPEGDYDFTVEKFERGRSKGEGKYPACNMATVYFTVHGHGRDVTVRENYLLHENMRWKLAELFRGVGLARPEDENIKMNWTALPGLTGRAKVTLVPGIKDPTKKFNQIDKLYPKAFNKFTPGVF